MGKSFNKTERYLNKFTERINEFYTLAQIELAEEF